MPFGGSTVFSFGSRGSPATASYFAISSADDVAAGCAARHAATSPNVPTQTSGCAFTHSRCFLSSSGLSQAS